MANYKLTVCYDGGRYKGWQKQGNTGSTVQEKLETVLSRRFGEPIEIAGAGRTDAGVHAKGQVCSFHAPETDCDALLSDLRAYLPEDIGALALERAPERFHARLCCTGKKYVYRLWNSPEPNVFERKYIYAFPEPLDVAAMNAAGERLCGEHDYTSFCANRHMKKSAVRRVDSITAERTGGEIRLSFTGSGFLYNMVRILTGTLIEVGTGKRTPESMDAVLAARDRDQAGFTAPAQGLVLEEVYY